MTGNKPETTIDLFTKVMQSGDPTIQIVEDIFSEKYAKEYRIDNNQTLVEGRPQVYKRVARALAENEAPELVEHWYERFLVALDSGFMPGGRITSAAGTSIQATLINCFVQPVGDTSNGIAENGKVGIYPAIGQAGETMRRGGGVGYDFSDIRPKGARVKGTHSRASGPVSYMQIFDRSCEVVESAGARRGAQMGVLRCDHPDIQAFITSKDIRDVIGRLDVSGLDWAEADALRSKLRKLSKFNISVAVTDALVEAVKNGGDFDLVHVAEPDPAEHPSAYQREDGKWVYKTVNAKELWDQIIETTYYTADPGVIFIDTVNGLNNLHYAELIEASNPCGEQMLPSYGCCCLGSVAIHRFVENAFMDNARINFRRLAEIVKDGVRMLDNVLDVTMWPLDEQAAEAHAKRRIGMGFTGLACAMAMVRVKYNSEEGVKLAEKVQKTITQAAYEASVELAKEKGAFPLFDAEQYTQSKFVNRALSRKLSMQIAKHGIRNSHLLSIAPTGTISIALGANCSGGIEPNFGMEFHRTKIMEDGSKQMFRMRPYSYLAYEQVHGATKAEDLPEYFVTTDQCSVEDHLNIQAVVQKYVDSAVSKTVNIPADYSYEQFQAVYLKAHALGLKGCTTYRPNDITGAVLTRTSDVEASSGLDQTDVDRRIVMDKLPEPALNSLRWPGRPDLPEGNPSQTYMVEGGQDARFSVVVGHVENGEKTPFEVWVNGAEQPRGLGATAKLLSMDMRSNDRAWLQMKLDALMMTKGHPIVVEALPGNLRQVPFSSPTAALMHVVKKRCEELGAFEGERPTPVLDALMSKKEPKTGPTGTMSWSVDIRNPSTGDDVVLMLKEMVLPTGERRPFSVWMAGDYPRDFDGLCKMLSLDMRVLDLAWIGEKLRKLKSYSEPQGDFLTMAPGSDKGKRFPSTIAYIAEVIHHRFMVLGLLNDEYAPVNPLGIMSSPVSATESPGSADKLVNQIRPGKQCPACGMAAVIKINGCDLCTACGQEGSCG